MLDFDQDAAEVRKFALVQAMDRARGESSGLDFSTVDQLIIEAAKIEKYVLTGVTEKKAAAKKKK